MYGLLGWWSLPFEYGRPEEARPILLVMLLLAALFVLYLRALRTALRMRATAGFVQIVIVFALAFRLVLLFTPPILEVDLYRYIWDGHVTAAGLNPFQFSPAEVMAAGAGHIGEPDLERIIAVRNQSLGLREILSRVHYAELPTVYPPTSQFMFALAAWTTPRDADVATLRLVMKCWILAFDVGSLLLLWRLHTHLNWPLGWTLAYGWCPLVLKEFANSGHLDSIAVFFTVAAVNAAVFGLFPRPAIGRRRQVAWVLTASVLLAVGVGAKLYPVVLGPLLLVTILRRLGGVTAILTTIVFLGVASMLLSPFVSHKFDAFADMTRAGLPSDTPSVRIGHDSVGDPSRGLRTFLTQWKMNDFLFLLTEANLRPTSKEAVAPWFAVTPDVWRSALTATVAPALGQPADQVPFLLARLLTCLAFMGLALWWAWRAAFVDSSAVWCRYVFLTLAWFWLLSPTQNPWYWT